MSPESTSKRTMNVERTGTIAAPADRIYALLADLRAWEQWSPWEELDPAMKHTYSGAPTGVGAIHEWSGNRKAGVGKMVVTAANEPSSLDLALTFIKPFRSENTTRFDLTEADDTTTIRWSMLSPVTFMTRVFGVFMNMDKMIGRDFEKGLANLRRIAEA